jgi:hypothetical protein
MYFVLFANQVFDFSSVTTIIQLLAFLLAIVGYYIYHSIKDKNNTLVDLYKLAKKDDVAQLIEMGKSVVPIPDKLTKNQQYELIKHQIEQKHAQYRYKIVITIISIILFFAVIIALIIIPAPAESAKDVSVNSQLEFSESSAKVIGIYPKDGFGPDQKKGLHAVFDGANLGIDIIDLDFVSLKEMKNRNVEEILDTLEYLLKKENVVAIVGPSISECTVDIFKLLYDSKSKVPMFVTGAASSDFLQWKTYKSQLNIFRIGSSIEQRAHLIANFFKGKHISTQSLFVVEDNSPKPTFGKMYFDELMNSSDVLTNARESGNIEVIRYNTENAGILAPISAEMISRFDYVFVLGVGEKFTSIINEYYKVNSSNSQRPKIGGWMNAFSLNPIVGSREQTFLNKKILEITDLNIARAEDQDTKDASYLKKFEIQMHSKIHPGLRDIAITYDAGICIIDTYKTLIGKSTEVVPGKFVKFNNDASNTLAGLLHKKTFEAISSKIKFNEDGMNENIGLNCAIFDSEKNKWDHVFMHNLLDL